MKYPKNHYLSKNKINNNMIKINYPGILFILLMMAGNTMLAQSPCISDSISFSTTISSCPGNSNGTATVTIHGGNPPYTYLWSTFPAQTSQTAINLMPLTYSVLITDSTGCIDTGSVTIEAIEVPAICMVTVNGNSTNNIIYWDRTLYPSIDSFIVYREVSPSSYTRIGSVSNDSLGQLIDTARNIGPANGDPNIASYRYKLQVRDTCGYYSSLSPYHNTIHIVDDGLGAFSWSIPYTIEGSINPVSNYVLLCDTANVDVWGPVSVVSGTMSSATDPGFADHSNIANWRVKTNWGIVCDPERATVNTTRSNIKHGALTTGITAELLSASVYVYPNPACDQVTIGLSPQINQASIRIENMMGQLMFQENINAAGTNGTNKRIDLNNYSKGIYLINIESKNTRIFKRFVVE